MKEINEALVRQIAEIVIKKIQEQENLITIGVSNRHVHVSRQDFEKLFGSGSKLTKIKDLGQPGQFAAEETLSIIGPKGKLTGVRILGPFRDKTQVEISKSDEFLLGVKAPVRESGDLSGTSGIMIQGPAGELELTEGMISALRHVHLDPETAGRLNVKNGDVLNIRTEGERALIFDRVIARVSENYLPEMHIDTDEANASGLQTGDKVCIVR
jgi:putative phosphotransacetylase